MKFAKTLEDIQVPEWKSKYVDYKIGKKRIKATTNRLRNATESPAISSLRRTASRVHTAANESKILPTRALSLLRRPSLAPRPHTERPSPQHHVVSTASPEWSPTYLEHSPLQSPQQQLQSPTPQSPGRRKSSTSYGTVGVSPGFTTLVPIAGGGYVQPVKPPSLLLPDPIQPLSTPVFDDGPILDSSMSTRTQATLPDPFQPSVSRSNSAPTIPNTPLLKRIFTLRRGTIVPVPEFGATIEEVQAEAEKEFLRWLLGELKKCEDFYLLREIECVKRFDEMREQLDIMRDRWFKAKHNIPFEEDDVEDLAEESTPEGSGSEADNATFTAGDRSEGHKKRVGWKSFADTMNGLMRSGTTTSQVDTGVMHAPADENRDYVRRTPARKPLNNPVHRVAKHKLKRAYIEYYHGLEMLKSYVTVNRECFRKITKKFDKASGLRTSHRFMTEYVDKSLFGSANNDLDELLNDTESLFARFFERGNRKEASARLRSRENKTLYYGSVWKSGFYLGASSIIGAYGVYQAVLKLKDGSDPARALRTSYLLQIWGGVALILAQTLLFAINLRVWARNKINYSFIFEFDIRHQLNYRQFLEFPALLSLIFTLCLWFSTHDFFHSKLDMIYWPIIFVAITCALLFNPFKLLYFHSRMWFLKVLWRLLWSGCYPVEFKDFWMGDMLCSQTYALGNISLFFCLYANSWDSPAQCNSNHSRLMGFFTTMPGIFRLLQCFRRYYNSKAVFPHLVNGGKYACTILHYMTLSLWRLDYYNHTPKAVFITFATLNSIYTTVWDIGMDWSLLDPYAKSPFLRKGLGFKSTWPYYLAMLVDPVIRCNWFFYIIYAGQLQHSALLSFMLALSEVLRRFMWCFFRMENEHIGNVGANRAYRNLPLPYHMPCSPEEIRELTDLAIPPASSSSIDLDVERGASIRRRVTRTAGGPNSPMVRTMTRVGRSLNQAHLQDYERRRNREDEEASYSGESDDEEDEEDYYERTREEGGVRERRGTVGSRM